MIRTPGKPESFKGSAPSIAATTLPEGLFSLCSGGIPSNGSFKRLPGKVITDAGISTGGAITIYQFGEKVVVQRPDALEIFDLYELSPSPLNYVYDNEGRLVYDNFGLKILTE